MNLDNLKRLASEKGRLSIVNTDDYYSSIQDSCNDDTIDDLEKQGYSVYTSAAHTEKLAQALSKLIEVVEEMSGALDDIAEFNTCEKLHPGCEKYHSYGAGWQGVAVYAQQALTRANDLIGGI